MKSERDKLKEAVVLDTKMAHEAYLLVGDQNDVFSWKFPHHEIKDGKLELSLPLMDAAFKALLKYKDSYNIPRIAAARHLLKHYGELGHQPKDLAGMSSYHSYEEAASEINMLTVLCNIGSSYPADFFPRKGIEEIQKDLDSLPILGTQIKEIGLEEIIAAIVALDDDEEEQEQEQKSGKELKKEFRKFRKFVRNKGLDADLCEDGKTVICKAPLLKFSNAGKRTKEDYYPSMDELYTINQSYSNTDLRREDVFVFDADSADTKIDRQDEQFTDDSLWESARLSLDKAFLIDHNWTTPSQIGKIFAATVQDGVLKQKVYILNDPMNERYIKNMLAGIYNKVSVGFASDMKDMVCNSCSNGTSIYDMSCPHKAGGMDSEGNRTTVTISSVKDFFELSLVPIPAQRDAGIRARTLAFQGALAKEKILDALSGDKSVDTIISSNILQGDLKVPEATTTSSTDTIDASKKEADVFVASTEATAEAIVPAADSEVVIPEAPAKDMTSHFEDVSAPRSEPIKPNKLRIPSKVRETVKKLRKSVKDLKEIAKEQREFLASMKTSADAAAKASEEKLTLLVTAQEEQAKTIKSLSQIVEAATTVTVETLERQVAAKKQITNPRNVEGNKWASDLAKGILGGNK